MEIIALIIISVKNTANSMIKLVTLITDSIQIGMNMK